jgi:hypothetical protein
VFVLWAFKFWPALDLANIRAMKNETDNGRTDHTRKMIVGSTCYLFSGAFHSTHPARFPFEIPIKSNQSSFHHNNLNHGKDTIQEER